MQDEHLGFWSFPIFFSSVALGNNFSKLNQAFIKSIRENQALKRFMWAIEAKHHS